MFWGLQLSRRVSHSIALTAESPLSASSPYPGATSPLVTANCWQREIINRLVTYLSLVRQVSVRSKLAHASR